MNRLDLVNQMEHDRPGRPDGPVDLVARWTRGPGGLSRPGVPGGLGGLGGPCGPCGPGEPGGPDGTG